MKLETYEAIDMKLDFETYLDRKKMKRSIKRDDEFQQEKARTLENSLNLVELSSRLARRNPSLLRKKERGMGGK